MRAWTSGHSQGLPAWLSVPVWLALFLCPTAFILSLIVIDRLHVPAPSEGVVVSLFCLVPVIALLACGTVVWYSTKTLGWRVGGLLLTALAMAVQCGAWFVIIVSAISAAISLG